MSNDSWNDVYKEIIIIADKFEEHTDIALDLAIRKWHMTNKYTDHAIKVAVTKWYDTDNDNN